MPETDRVVLTHGVHGERYKDAVHGEHYKAGDIISTWGDRPINAREAADLNKRFAQGGPFGQDGVNSVSYEPRHALPHLEPVPAIRTPDVRTTWERHELSLEHVVAALSIDALPTDSIEWTVRDDGKLEIIVRREVKFP
jgi:hypothetical protein